MFGVLLFISNIPALFNGNFPFSVRIEGTVRFRFVPTVLSVRTVGPFHVSSFAKFGAKILSFLRYLISNQKGTSGRAPGSPAGVARSLFVPDIPPIP